MVETPLNSKNHRRSVFRRNWQNLGFFPDYNNQFRALSQQSCTNKKHVNKTRLRSRIDHETPVKVLQFTNLFVDKSE